MTDPQLSKGEKRRNWGRISKDPNEQPTLSHSQASIVPQRRACSFMCRLFQQPGVHFPGPHTIPPVGAGRGILLRPFVFSPYSPECVELEFSEVNIDKYLLVCAYTEANIH